jgi:hypothetical protein
MSVITVLIRLVMDEIRKVEDTVEDDSDDVA